MPPRYCTMSVSVPIIVSSMVSPFIEHKLSNCPFFQTDQRQQDRVHQARHILRTCIFKPSVSFYLYILFFSYSQMKTSESFPGKLDF